MVINMFAHACGVEKLMRPVLPLPSLAFPRWPCRLLVLLACSSWQLRDSGLDAPSCMLFVSASVEVAAAAQAEEGREGQGVTQGCSCHEAPADVTRHRGVLTRGVLTRGNQPLPAPLWHCAVAHHHASTPLCCALATLWPHGHTGSGGRNNRCSPGSDKLARCDDAHVGGRCSLQRVALLAQGGGPGDGSAFIWHLASLGVSSG